MGMQCTFSYSDLTDQTQWETRAIHDKDSDTWTVEVKNKPVYDWEISELIVSFNLAVPADREAGKMFCWFDIGQWNEEQQYMIGLLVRNRIPFTCA